MADEKFNISGSLRVEPTKASRAGLAAMGIRDRSTQNACYATLAQGLARAEGEQDLGETLATESARPSRTAS